MAEWLRRPIRNKGRFLIFEGSNPSRIQKQGGAAEACWAHNPKVEGSIPSSDI